MIPAKRIDRHHVPALDGLRAVSIFLVLFEHWITPAYGVGGVGVSIFFVLSGYLITKTIVVENDAGFTAKSRTVNFFGKRALRLFPAYYICILLALILNIGDIKAVYKWDLGYLANIRVALNNSWNGSSHFWSLAVEEQFYLVWFFLMAFTNRRTRLFIILFALCLGPLFRAGLFLDGQTSFKALLLPGVVDNLAAGAFLYHFEDRLRAIFAGKTLMLLGASVAFLIVLKWFAFAFPSRLLFVDAVLDRTAGGLVGISAVMAALFDSQSRFFHWMNNRWVGHVGKVSYGMYVYHYFFAEIAGPIWPQSPASFVTGLFRFLVALGVLLCLVEVSWRFVEKPALRLKRYLTLSKPRGTPQRLNSAAE